MQEVTGNLWTFEAPVVVITTNGYLRSDGKPSMGRGSAGEAAERYHSCVAALATELKRQGNHVAAIGRFRRFPAKDHNDVRYFDLLTFPTKETYRGKASLSLIERSAHELVDCIEKDETVVMPRPGCGTYTGRLDWETQVKPLLKDILDERFFVIDFGSG